MAAVSTRRCNVLVRDMTLGRGGRRIIVRPRRVSIAPFDEILFPDGSSFHDSSVISKSSLFGPSKGSKRQAKKPDRLSAAELKASSPTPSSSVTIAVRREEQKLAGLQQSVADVKAKLDLTTHAVRREGEKLAATQRSVVAVGTRLDMTTEALKKEERRLAAVQRSVAEAKAELRSVNQRMKAQRTKAQRERADRARRRKEKALRLERQRLETERAEARRVEGPRLELRLEQRPEQERPAAARAEAERVGARETKELRKQTASDLNAKILALKDIPFVNLPKEVRDILQRISSASNQPRIRKELQTMLASIFESRLDPLITAGHRLERDYIRAISVLLKIAEANGLGRIKKELKAYRTVILNQ